MNRKLRAVRQLHAVIKAAGPQPHQTVMLLARRQSGTSEPSKPSEPAKASAQTMTEQNRQRAVRYMRENVSSASGWVEGAHAVEEWEGRQHAGQSEFGEKNKREQTAGDGLSGVLVPETKPGARVAAEARLQKHMVEAGDGVRTARAIALLLREEHGARDVVVLDVRTTAAFTDWMVVATGLTNRHVVAIADGIQSDMRVLGVASGGGDVAMSGRGAGDWVVVDVVAVVVHVMTEEARAHYGIESLWSAGDDTDGSV